MTFPLDPRGRPRDPDLLMESFLELVANRGLELYPAQEEAIIELFSGHHVILNTPTGSGKSLVAAALHFLSAATGRISVYTCPIKALVSEKFLSLCRDFGPEQVGMMTGDASVNRHAPILCCTAEILANIALRGGERALVHDVIMDEFHYYSDRDRGVAWQVPLLALPQSRFLLMSATVSDTDFFAEDLRQRTGRPCSIVRSTDRPVPLDFTYLTQSLTEALESLQGQGKMPVYIVHFTQRSACETAQSLLSMTFCSKDEKARIKEALADVRFPSPFGKEIRKLMLNGVGLHHAGLLPKYRLLVEKVAQKGLLKAICGTDTLGVGVNVPIRTVLFTQLCKFDGSRTKTLAVRDFHQISGRAGRRGFDSIGHVACLAPAHVVENLRIDAKILGDPKKKKKLVRRKPPERGYVHWDEQTFQRLQNSPPEPLVSHFAVSHGMLLNVLSRPEEDGCEAMRSLIGSCHETEAAKSAMRHQAWQLFRALVERSIIDILPAGSNRKLEVNVELQDDFSLNQSLSLYCLDTLALLDPSAPGYVFKLLSLVESILEHPDAILRRQLDKLKSEAIAEMKAEGIEYDERMAMLEEIEYPKPESEFIYATFNQFAAAHPWVGNDHIRPKSIAREMYETYCGFADYVVRYGLQRSEGILLRHLASVYRVLEQTVPPVYKTEAVAEAITYFEQILRSTDSSLLDEWERLRNPGRIVADEAPVEPARDITQDREGFARLVRHQVFRFVSMLAHEDYDTLQEEFPLATLFPGSQSPARDLQAHMAAYYEGHERIRLDPGARAKVHTRLVQGSDEETLTVIQTLVDPEEHNDYECVFSISLTQVRESASVVLEPLAIHPCAPGG